MKKIILWSIAGILVLGTASAAIWWSSRPQTLLLKDGTKLTFLGVTSGRHHVPPKIKVAGARNRGLAEARGEVIVFADSHIDVPVHWWEPIVATLNRPHVGVVGPAIGIMGKPELPAACGQRIAELNLRRPIFRKTAAYGHFGRADKDFTWERTNKAAALKAAVGGTTAAKSGRKSAK